MINDDSENRMIIDNNYNIDVDTIFNAVKSVTVNHDDAFDVDIVND